jgi:hypothetical protein
MTIFFIGNKNFINNLKKNSQVHKICTNGRKRLPKKKKERQRSNTLNSIERSNEIRNDNIRFFTLLKSIDPNS